MTRVKIGFILLAAMLLITAVAYGREPVAAAGRRGVSADSGLYAGEWYEIARFNHPFQEGVIESRVVYQLLPENKIRIVYQGKDGKTGQKKITRAKGRLAADSGFLRVSSFWFFYSDYTILASDPGAEWQWVVVSGRSSKYLWILARRPQLSTRMLTRILNLVERQGVDIGKLRFVDQRRNIEIAEKETRISRTDTRGFLASADDPLAGSDPSIRFPADSSARE